MRLNNIMKKIIFLFVFILLSCSDSKRVYDKILPKNYNISSFKKDYYSESPISLGYKDDFFLIYVPVLGQMSFSSNNNHLGLYYKNKKVDELVLGSIPLKLMKWTKDKIYLKVSGEKSYLDSWLLRPENKKIGKFSIVWIY